jgi:hypothetical protein
MLTGTCHCGAARSCTLCRRYGALWIYDYEGEKITLAGPSAVYTRKERTDPVLEIHFCASCGCVIAWRGLRLEADGRRRIAVNLRLTEPEPVAGLPIDHFDGLDTFDDLPRDGRCVGDLWF